MESLVECAMFKQLPLSILQSSIGQSGLNKQFYDGKCYW